MQGEGVGVCGLDLWAGDARASPLGIPGWRKEAGPRAGALSSALRPAGASLCVLGRSLPLSGAQFPCLKWRRPWTRPSAIFLSAFVT